MSLDAVDMYFVMITIFPTDMSFLIITILDPSESRIFPADIGQLFRTVPPPSTFPEPLDFVPHRPSGPVSFHPRLMKLIALMI